MAAVTKDFTIEKGATFQHRFTWQDENGDAVTLETSEYTARMHIRKKKSDTTTLVTLAGPTQDEADGSITLDDDGNIDLEIPADITAAVEEREGVYDLELVDADGRVTRLVQGSVTFDDEVTK